VLVVTHDHRLERYAHRTIAMEDGLIRSQTLHAQDQREDA
jgi:ABC-type lipoprotein export system ATPase subunit